MIKYTFRNGKLLDKTIQRDAEEMSHLLKAEIRPNSDGSFSVISRKSNKGIIVGFKDTCPIYANGYESLYELLAIKSDLMKTQRTTRIEVVLNDV